ncbi:hypothetical protein AK812_SmicGene9319 [Symbiodinium microadriaticum]|uniref:Uncharacterized protein n=1 Tax=Symbiodinium microadriaticum TaxID=2951 RepID=A0A1Q9EIL9_SYMMI|nr:hypothetical protein AK812_SmicGene9319 [Symbiodinium microadriaticum]
MDSEHLKVPTAEAKSQQVTRVVQEEEEEEEFGKDALFDSLFPDLKQFKEEYDSKGGWWEVWLMLGFIVLLFVGLPAANGETRRAVVRFLLCVADDVERAAAKS